MSINTLESFEAYIQDAEQDQEGDGDLPTYDDLAAQQNPNSRFGRWRGWIEKRAAERYADTAPEELTRRRARGWGDNQEQSLNTQTNEPNSLMAAGRSYTDQGRVTPTPLRVTIVGDLPDHPVSSELDQSGSQPISALSTSSADQQVHGTACETLLPTHLQLHQFGSRFLPHTTSPIRCILPINHNRILLVGTDSGLSVLDMYPMEWASDGDIGVIQKGPGDAQARIVWTGEAVHQMSILEYEDIGEGTPQGVVLALVGPEPDAPCASNGHQESLRTLRMYNLTSLMSLAKWAIAQKGTHPVDLRRASDWNIQQTPVRKHRPASSITRGLKHLIDSPTRAQHPATSYESYLAAPNAKRQTDTASADASWDVVDDLPLRWATDFVPLASAGSRLASTSVISYSLWHEGGAGPGGGRHGRRALLAVATKHNIFMYETPKGERAFHFVKEFYLPAPPRALMFVHQSVQDFTRSSTENSSPRQSGHAHSRGSSSDSHFSSHGKHASVVPLPHLTYGAQMAMFVVFEKKASVIRIADAAVTEVEMYDTGSTNALLSSGGSFMAAGKDTLSVGSSLGSRRSRASIDFIAFKEGKGTWILPSVVDLPATLLSSGDITPEKSVCVLTRGKNTHVVPAPLPAIVQSAQPIHVLVWSFTPSSLSVRVCAPRNRSSETPPFVQFIAFGEDGVEAQEIPLAVLALSYGASAGAATTVTATAPNAHNAAAIKGKGKAGSVAIGAGAGAGTGSGVGGIPTSAVMNAGTVMLSDPCRSQSFIGETGFLAHGGHWHRITEAVAAPVLERADSAASGRSFESVHTDEVVARLRAEAGVYGWLRKSVEDWRVFWVGGDTRDVSGYDDEEDGVLV